jgi:hypothetical protein
VKSFGKGLLNLATARSSLASLYNPIVVGNTCGLSINIEYSTFPFSSIIDGFVV